jgi:hypothetical protein
MYIPTELKIGGKIWKVIIDHKKLDISKYMGLCKFDTREILLNSKLPRNKLEEVFLHEYLHATFPEFIVGEVREERIVLHLASKLYKSMIASGLTISKAKKVR